jgi:hypothetical protein
MFMTVYVYMDILQLCLIGIGMLSLIGYIVFRLATDKIEMNMDKGGTLDAENRYQPDMQRNDIQDFLAQCDQEGFSKHLSEEFLQALFALFNFGGFKSEPPAPKLTDDLCGDWGIDDDIDDLINPILKKHETSLIECFDLELQELVTIRDILNYVQIRISREHSQRQANQSAHTTK